MGGSKKKPVQKGEGERERERHEIGLYYIHRRPSNFKRYSLNTNTAEQMWSNARAPTEGNKRKAVQKFRFHQIKEVKRELKRKKRSSGGSASFLFIFISLDFPPLAPFRERGEKKEFDLRHNNL